MKGLKQRIMTVLGWKYCLVTKGVATSCCSIAEVCHLRPLTCAATRIGWT